MGGVNSKETTRGTLQSACAPSLLAASEGLTLLPEPIHGTETVQVRVPPGKSSGDAICIALSKNRVAQITVPYGKNNRPLSGGDSFRYKHAAEIHKVLASTLPVLPGYEMVQSKPIIWGSVSHSFSAGAQDQQCMGSVVGDLLQEAHDALLTQAIEAECNAVLGMSFNITNDSSGKAGERKLVIVTGYGTPCIVLPMGAAGMSPATTATAAAAAAAASATAMPPLVQAQAIFHVVDEDREEETSDSSDSECA